MVKRFTDFPLLTAAQLTPNDVFVGAEVEGNTNFRITVTQLALLVGGGGALLAANNLSDLANVVTARANLGVTAIIEGLKWKANVYAATVTGGNLNTDFANGATIDGQQVFTGSRILIKNQPTSTENGIYTVNASGPPTRATDADTSAEISAAIVLVSFGTVNANRIYVTQPDLILGLSGITWTHINGASGALLAANNLSDVADAPTARTNLGLGTAALAGLGTSGTTVPLLDGANSWAALQQFLASLTVGSGAVAGTVTTKAPSTGAGKNLELRAASAADGNNIGGDVVIEAGLKAGSGTNGKIIIRAPAGTVDNEEIWLEPVKGFNNARIHSPSAAGNLTITSAIGAVRIGGSAANFSSVGNGGIITGTSGFVVDVSNEAYGQTPQCAFKSAAAGIAQITDGGSGVGRTRTGTPIEANTAVAASPNILTALESRTLLTNEGATALNCHTLPSAVAGLDQRFIVQDTDGIKITAAAGDTIRDLASVSVAGGFIQSTVVGSTIRLVAINATEWVVEYSKGTWTIDS